MRITEVVPAPSPPRLIAPPLLPRPPLPFACSLLAECTRWHAAHTCSHARQRLPRSARATPSHTFDRQTNRDTHRGSPTATVHWETPFHSQQAVITSGLAQGTIESAQGTYVQHRLQSRHQANPHIAVYALSSQVHSTIHTGCVLSSQVHVSEQSGAALILPTH